MRDVLLAEVTLKIKKTWHIKWQLKSVKFGGYVFLFLFLLFFSFSSFNQLVVSQFVSFWLCLRGDTANVKSSAPGSSSFSSFFSFLFFSSLHRGTGKALLWFTSFTRARSLARSLALCFPECHCNHRVPSAIALCQHLVAVATRSDKCAKRRHRRRHHRHPVAPLSVVFLPRCHISAGPATVPSQW